jgi:polyphosphate kinase 2 (PPK2 family)
VRVHPEILAGEGVPDGKRERPVWKRRFRSIRDLERHLHRNGTRIVKFFLHLSPEEQRKRFLKRLERPDKQWKIGPADLEERKFWKDYLKAYEDCLGATSTRQAPWFAVPADNKDDARLIISQIILETLRDLKMSHPAPDASRKRELKRLREMLTKE